MGWILVLLPTGLLILGHPVFLVLLASSCVLFLLFIDVPLTVVHQTMFGSVDKYALMAIPFFIFMGELMGQGGMSRRIVDWVLSTVGGVRGSMALTAVGTCTFFGAISGSSSATVAAVGRLLYPALRDRGYGETLSVGLITSTGAIALIIPPSVTMIIYGAAAEESVIALFMAGIGPGLLIALLVALYLVYYARTRGIRDSSPFAWSRFVRASRAGVLALGAPTIILGGIYGGIFTPTEAAGVGGIYAILVSRLAYRDASWSQIWRAGIVSVFLTAQVTLIVAAAGVYSWVLTITGVPQAVVGIIEAIGADPWALLLLINAFLLLVGCAIDPVSAILLLTPLLLPIAKSIGLDPVHFGIILIVNLSIGMFTPPFGINIFVSQALFGVPLGAIYRGLLPFILINIIGLLIISYVPVISLYPVRLLL